MSQQTELEILRPPSLQKIGFGYDSQNYNVYRLLHDRYTFNPTINSWVSTKQISKVVPGGVTRRIHDCRVALQPDKTLRGHVGWWVENRMQWVYDPAKDRKVQHSWYRLVYLTEKKWTTVGDDHVRYGHRYST